MNREAFRNRMQQLKQYREQNPGKTYLDWKQQLPENLQDESSYNLKRAYELGYEPQTVEGDSLKHLPTRDQETGEILKKPWHPTFLIGLLEDAKLGYYPQIKNGTTYTTTWEGNENPIYKYVDGGEVPPSNKPIIPEEPQPYKGKLYKDRYGRKYTEDQLADYYDNSSDEIDRFTGKPFIRGLRPIVDLEDAANVTPIGDAISIYDTYEALRNKDWSGAGLAAMGLIPFMPMTVKQFRSSYKGITPKVKRPIPKVNRAAEQLEKDRIIEAARREQYLKPKARNEGYKVVERLQDDPDYFNRAMQVRKQFGDNYMRTYADLISTYNTNPSKLPQVELTNNLPNARAQMGATTSAANRHMAGGEFPRMEEFNYRIDPTKTDLSGNVTEHGWNHLVDYLTNKTPGASGNSNLFYKMSEDISNDKIDKHFEYYMRPTEQKAYMNQIREYLFNSGKINRRGDKVDAKLLQQTLNTLKDTDTYGSAVRASKQFKNINKYTKWFNSIPLLGLGTAAVYKGTEQNE